MPSAWRLPDADPHAFVDVGHYIRVAQIAEAAKFDAVFLADNAAIIEQIDFRPITALEPTVLRVNNLRACRGVHAEGQAKFNLRAVLRRRQVLVVFLTRVAFFPIAVKNYGLSVLDVQFPVFFAAALQRPRRPP